MKLENKKLIYSPSDLALHSSCKHLTELNKQLAKGDIAAPPKYQNRTRDMLIAKGIEWEEQHLEETKEEGKTVVEIDMKDRDAEKHTIDAMKAGVDIIYQARLKEEGKWSGWADFLKKVPKPSALGDWSYMIPSWLMKLRRGRYCRLGCIRNG